MIPVGVNRVGYPEIRNIWSLPLRRYVHRRVLGVYQFPAWLAHQLGRNIDARLHNTFRPIGNFGCALHHLFNGVSLGGAPWISSFETMLPRWSSYPPGCGRWGDIAPKDLRRGMQLLAGDSCKRLVAISESASKIQRAFLEAADPALADAIMRKVTVLHPAQEVLPGAAQRSWCPGGIVRFCFVGRQFFVKGGAEMLSAFHQLYRSGQRNWHLHVVSSLETQPERSYLSSMSAERVQQIAAACRPCITIRPGLSNAAVMALLQESDVSLLPSYADTYGYVVLESQASGTPVVTTNVRALAELNDDRTGWVVPLAVDDLGYAKIADGPEASSARARLLEGLASTLESICTNPEAVRPKALAALNRVAERHNPALVAARLESIYDEALR